MDEDENSQKGKTCLFHLRKIEIGLGEKLGEKSQGTKLHELMIVDPCNFLDFTKLVWPILEQRKMWGIFEIQATLNYGPHF